MTVTPTDVRAFAPADAARSASWTRLFFGIAFAATALRTVGLIASDANLGPDEAQYWLWSRDLAFGYFSKPPLIAWTIAATTALFGDAAWAVRLAAPLFHAGAALFVFAAARRLHGPEPAFWAGLGWLTLPGVTLSSALITTDAPLLFFWSAALFFLVRLAAEDSPRSGRLADAAGLGLSLGLGLLAKYAMIYFPIALGAALILAPELRRRIGALQLCLAGALALAIVAPNLWWNAANEFQTISHTAANADWGGRLFRPAAFAEFGLAQFGVFGPILFALFAAAVWRVLRRPAGAGPIRGIDVALLALALLPLAVVSVQALLSRAHANWAATAYPAALLLVAGLMSDRRIALAMRASVVFHAAAAAGFLIVFSNFAAADALGLSRSVKRLRGWEETAADVLRAAEGCGTIVVDDRETMASLLYYARGGPPIRSWNSNGRIDHHFEASMPYIPDGAPCALFVSFAPDASALLGRHGAIAAAGSSVVDLKADRTRTFYFFRVEGLAAAP